MKWPFKISHSNSFVFWLSTRIFEKVTISKKCLTRSLEWNIPQSNSSKGRFVKLHCFNITKQIYLVLLIQLTTSTFNIRQTENYISMFCFAVLFSRFLSLGKYSILGTDTSLGSPASVHRVSLTIFQKSWFFKPVGHFQSYLEEVFLWRSYLKIVHRIWFHLKAWLPWQPNTIVQEIL